jgi:hypothetical protein
MINLKSAQPYLSIYRFATFLCLVTLGIIPHVNGQAPLKVKGEPALCRVKVNDKTFELKVNGGGYFQRIPNVPKNAVVPVEIFYPNGIEGEKIIISVLDGGRIDQEIVKVINLDKEKKCAFNLTVTDQIGSFRVLVIKGDDEKVVQVWVGPETKPVLQ